MFGHVDVGEVFGGEGARWLLRVVISAYVAFALVEEKVDRGRALEGGGYVALGAATVRFVGEALDEAVGFELVAESRRFADEAFVDDGDDGVAEVAQL